MDSITERLSIFDYFNLLIGGMIFLLALGIYGYPETCDCLLKISVKVDGSIFLFIIAMALFIGVSFVFGTVINELGQWFFIDMLKRELKLVNKCLTSVDVVGNKAKFES